MKNSKSSRTPHIIRRSQLISPWGVGSIVSFPDDSSLMIAGLDAWRYGDNESDLKEFLINEDRLKKRLGVGELRWPPEYRERNSGLDNTGLTIPAVRFPRWYYCPNCGTMKKLGYFSNVERCTPYKWSNGRICKTPNRTPKMIPERLVVICPEGHIDDFPIMQYIHDSNNKEIKNTCVARRSVWGGAPSLSGIRYSCSCGVSKSLAGVFRDKSLDKYYLCKGSKPWLGIDKDEKHVCGKSVKVVYRGASNVWFSNTVSSLYIPPSNTQHNQNIIRIVDKFKDMVMSSEEDGKINEDIIKQIAKMENVDFNSLLSRFIEIDNKSKPIDEIETEDDYRFTEYKSLIKDTGNDTQDFFCKNNKIETYDKNIQRYFESISLVYKLRETRVFTGFSRVLPDSRRTFIEQRKNLSLELKNWLPAIEVYGEGIFIQFKSEELEKWEKNPNVDYRINKLNESHRKNCELWGNEFNNLNPRYLLLHTLAHLLINQLSYECGYGSSSLREKIFCNFDSRKHDMNGILIYTASGDSEGTFGGLVRMGKPGFIENTILSAIENATWCSSDPICIQSNGQGPGSLNLAACHDCTMLPETSCERGNKYLDRGLLIGDAKDQGIGFFSDI